MRIPYIPSPDWSRDLVTYEGGSSWTDSHAWSKGLSAAGVETLTGAWIGKIGGISKLPGVSKLLSKSDDLAKAGGKYLKNAKKALDDVHKVADDIIKAPKPITPLKEAAKSAAKGTKKALDAVDDKLAKVGDDVAKQGDEVPHARGVLDPPSSVKPKDGGCFVPGTLVEVACTNVLAISASESTAPCSISNIEPAYQSQRVAIEAVELGAVLRAINPEGDGYDPQISYATDLTQIHLRIEQKDRVVLAEVLRPSKFTDSLGIGDTLPVQSQELDVNGQATITDLKPFGRVTDIPGASLVTGRYITPNVTKTIKITFDNGEQVEGTPIHPIWIVDQQKFVPLGELEVGNTVDTALGNAKILSVEPKNVLTSVYNLEASGQSVYRIGVSGILVHNTGIDPCNPLVQLTDGTGKAAKITEPIIDLTKFSSKVRSKLNQVRKKYPDVRKGADGAADAQKLAEEAFKRGGGRVGPPVGQGADSAIYFDDGPVTWVFKPDGTFWSMRINNGWTP